MMTEDRLRVEREKLGMNRQEWLAKYDDGAITDEELKAGMSWFIESGEIVTLPERYQRMATYLVAQKVVQPTNLQGLGLQEKVADAYTRTPMSTDQILYWVCGVLITLGLVYAIYHGITSI